MIRVPNGEVSRGKRIGDKKIKKIKARSGPRDVA